MKRRYTAIAALAAAAALALTACTAGGSSGSESESESSSRDQHYEIVIFGEPAGAFWNVLTKGVEDAAAEYGVEVNVTGSSDGAEQALLIDAALAKDPDGMAVTIANESAVASSVQQITDDGIPWVTITAGKDTYEKYGAITHFGQDEQIAGEAAGKAMAESGATNIICLIHEPGNITLETRCDGVESGSGAKVTNVQVDLSNPQEIEATVRSTLLGNPDIDGIVALTGSVASSAAAGVEAAGVEVPVATFDLDSDVIAGVQDGTFLFAVDQQQYLQGYLAVVQLVMFNENLNTIGGGLPVLTGPSIVDASNAEQIAEYVKRGSR